MNFAHHIFPLCLHNYFLDFVTLSSKLKFTLDIFVVLGVK